MSAVRRHDQYAAEHPAYDPGASGPNGFPLCRWCLAELPRQRRDFCSDDCVHEFKLRANGSYARQAVFARDRGVCTHCGLDCGALDHIIAAMRRSGWSGRDGDDGQPDEQTLEDGERLALWTIEQLGFGRRRRVISLWQADHRVAVVEGGGRCGLGNYRTLCLLCHREQTRGLHRRLAAARRAWPG
jgi:hypothetical protein